MLHISIVSLIFTYKKYFLHEKIHLKIKKIFSMHFHPVHDPLYNCIEYIIQFFFGLVVSFFISSL